MSTSRSDEEKTLITQTKLKQLPVVAQFKGFVDEHSWLSPTEILLGYSSEDKVWNIETDSVTQVAKKAESRQCPSREDFLISPDAIIWNKLRISENEFLIIARETKFFSKENSELLIDKAQKKEMNRNNQEEKKPPINWQTKRYNIWGVYKKDKDGKYVSTQEYKQACITDLEADRFKAALLSENHIAIFATESRKMEFWKRESREQVFQHAKTVDLSHILKPLNDSGYIPVANHF